MGGADDRDAPAQDSILARAAARLAHVTTNAMLSILASLPLVAVPSALAQSPAAAAPVAPALLERVALMGASVSAGYGLATELDAELDLGGVLECALGAETGSVTVAADHLFFMDPHGLGRRFLDRVKRSEPTLVVALDYLFWFPFGPEPSEEARLAELETGLALLAELDCPLVIGDMPDVSQALEGRGPFGLPLVSPELLAAPETLVALNARLREWAAERGDVVIVPMAEFLARLRRAEPLALRANRWDPGALAAFLQPDLLHPTVDGSIALSLLTLDSLSSARAELAEVGIDWDAASVRERVMERTRAERERRAERARRRQEERERRAQERRAEDGGGGADAGGGTRTAPALVLDAA